jgi:uncharacterized membrane protein YdjX (TVP38/TMEM64 family)
MFSKNNNRFWTVLGLIFFIVLIFFVAKYFRDVEEIIRSAGLLGPVVAILLYAVLAATPITTDPLTVVSGVIFGPIMGIIISWLGNNAAALVEYYFGRHLGKVANFKKIKQKLPLGLNRLPVDSPWFLIVGRLVPGYGGKVISIMAGVYHVPISHYLWTTAITNLAGSLLLSYGGFHFIHFLKF